jgi:hypothetical protein
VTSERTARLLAFLIAALVVAIAIRYNTFAAWATDSGAYISAGYAWAKGDLFSPATFVFWAPWTSNGQVEFPLGHVQGPIKGTITGQYPLGYPLLIAAALKLGGGDLAPHLVSPVLAGVLAWCAFLLGRALATAWAGVLGALMIGATPVVLGHTVMPFSDVPAAALWALAWVMSVRPGYGAPLASGAAAALAITIRPNLAPLALVLAATVALADYAGWKQTLGRIVAFGVTGTLGPLLVLWSQAELYGHPLQNGYRVPMDYFFNLGRVPYNAGLYPRMLAELHSWVAFAGLLWVPFAVRGMRSSREAYARGLLTLSAVAMIIVNYALFLPYLTYVGWFWLRFLLPALLALFLLLAAAVDHLRLRLQPRWHSLAFLALTPAVFVAWNAEKHIRPQVGYERIHLMERYLPHVLPRNAVILTYAHGGAIAAATGRPILRIDYIEGNALDPIVQALQRRGYRPVYVFDVAVEGNFIGDRFKATERGRLTWPARAELASVTSIVYYDLADRDAFFSGERWPTDVLVAGRSTEGNVRWQDMRAEHERIVLPMPAESSAFRSQLDAIYRDRLGRSAATPSIDPGDLLRWFRRYLRLRLHNCSHDVALARIWQQLAKGGGSRLCAAPDEIAFPPEDESADFQRQLEERLRHVPIRQPPTPVDRLGEVVWTQRYVAARVRGCAHDEAVTAVTHDIAGEAPSLECAQAQPTGRPSTALRTP